MNKTCGAMTRKGTPCQKNPLKNGRCKLHGGKSTGPKDKQKQSERMKGNKNALKTGEYETISYDTLLEDEKELFNLVPEDPLTQVKGRFKLLEFRTRRLMKRYNDEMEKEKPDYRFIIRLEEALTRIDARVYELIRENRELTKQSNGESDGSLDQLSQIIDKARKQFAKQDV